MRVTLISPEAAVFDGEADAVIAPGFDGELGILPNHAPLLSTLKPGVVTVNKPGAGADRIFVRGGMVEVNPKGLTVLAEVAIPMAELNADALGRQIKNAEEDVADAKDDEVRRKATEALEHLKALRAAV